MSPLLADTILLIHFAFVLFVVGGLGLTWIGVWCGWRWIRNLQFRILHLAAIIFVAGEALLGIMCPLTEWEDALRGATPDKSFIARWVHRLMFFQFPEWVFTTAYVLFALVVVATWRWVPPQRPQLKK
jgi:hypothetical protein